MTYEVILYSLNIIRSVHLNMFFNVITIKCDARLSLDILLLMRELSKIFNDTNMNEKR